MADQTKLGQFDKTIRNCRVIDIPAGAMPKYISVRLPGENGELIDAWWTGSPKLAVNDYCKLLRQPDVPQYEIVGASGATAALPATHTHGADEITVDTAGFAGNLSAADDTVQKALDTLDDMAGSGGGNVWSRPGYVNIGATEYATLSAAEAAGSSGDVAVLGMGTHTGGVLVNVANFSIVGGNREKCIVRATTGTYCLNTSSFCENFTIQIEVTSPVSTIRAIVGSDINLNNMTLQATANTAGDATALNVAAGSSSLGGFGCKFVAIAPGGTARAIHVEAGTLYLEGGEITGNIQVDSGATIELRGVKVNSGSFTGSGTFRGWYYDASGNVIYLAGSGHNSGVWLVDESASLKTKYATLAAAITAAASSGDSIRLETDTYSIAARQDISKSLTIEGNGPEATILDFTVANDACFDFTSDNITVVFRNLTIDHSAGGSTAAGCLFTNNAGVKVILDNCIVKKSGGAPTTGYGAWWLAGTLELRNGSKLLCTSGTSKYGILNDSSGDVTVIIGPGCEVGGATADVYSNRAGSVIRLNNAILTNNLLTWTGTITDQSQVSKLYESDFGAVALAADASGNLTISAGKTLRFGSGQAVNAVNTAIANSNTDLPTGSAVYTHTNASAQVHGLPSGVHVLGHRAGAGRFMQSGAMSGVATDTSISIQRSSATGSLTFPVAFSSTPVVLAMGQDVLTGWCGLSSVTTTGFSYRTLAAGSVTVTPAYIAVGT